MDQFVIIPRSEGDISEALYLDPRVVKILSGMSITWMNRDTKIHRLASCNADSLLPTEFFHTEDIPSGGTTTVKIESTQPAIPYYCSLHPAERGLIVILPKDEDKMTNIQRSSFLDSIASSLFFDSENREIVTHLQRQVDPTVVEYLSNPNAVLLQNKVLTIVFWDISGFSILCEKLKDHLELIAEFLKEYLGNATRIIHEYGGVVDKFIGDGILAYFGFKENDDNDDRDGHIGAENAILAALKLKRSFEDVKNNWIEIWKKVIDSDIHTDIKCGINTGLVLVGLLRSGERDQFTVIGTNVNLSSRLEGIAEGGQVIISPFTMAKIQGKFHVEAITISNDKDKIKSFKDISEYYRVLGKVII
ncbi:MAG: adenylate/guanylate cyclase domain-containing protein [Nitrososphaeraceae archaeon]